MYTLGNATSKRHWIGMLAVGMFAVAPLLLGACGSGSSVGANGSLVITMEEMRFSPNRLDLKAGQSVTVTLVFRSPTATLTSEQVEGAVQKVIEAATHELGATLRS